MAAHVSTRDVEIASARFPDYDAFAESISGWSLEFRQVDAGDSPAELVQISAPGVLVTRARFERAYDQQGQSPVGMRTFAVLDPGTDGVHWCGRPFSDAEFAVFSERDGFEASSRPGFGVWTMSLADELLESCAATLGRSDRFDRVRAVGVSRAESAQLTALRALLAGLPRSVDASRSDLDACCERLTRSLPQLLLSIGGAPRETSPPAAPRLRDLAFERARTYALDQGGERPTVEGMREASGASWRTLDYAFRERLEVTPQNFLKAIRLDALRKALLDSDERARIVDLATEHGFRHMGQLAADYRRQFGELPSTTLARSRPSATRPSPHRRASQPVAGSR